MCYTKYTLLTLTCPLPTRKRIFHAAQMADPSIPLTITEWEVSDRDLCCIPQSHHLLYLCGAFLTRMYAACVVSDRTLFLSAMYLLGASASRSLFFFLPSFHAGSRFPMLPVYTTVLYAVACVALPFIVPADVPLSWLYMSRFWKLLGRNGWQKDSLCRWFAS